MHAASNQMGMTEIICLSLLVIAGQLTCVSSQRLSRQPGASGSEAVLLTVAEIQQSGVFGSDNDFLRRIAYVETRDGTSSDTFGDGYFGGIWAVDEDDFDRTRNVTANSRLRPLLDRIHRNFGIRWQSRQISWTNLRTPLHSAIAARLLMFLAGAVIPPSTDLQAQAMFWTQYYNPNGDISEFVSLSSGLEGSILESSANEFFVGFAANLNVPEKNRYLFVTTPEPQPVNFAVTANGYSFTGIATSNSSTRVDIPAFLEVLSTDDRRSGIRVKAEGDKLITVYGLSYHEFTSDAFLALPCTNLAVEDYEYYAVTYEPVGVSRSLILIVACEDNTLITAPGLSITLNQLQTYQIESTSIDLTGTKITSPKPVSVFGASECSNVPADVPFCDHLTEQLPPTATWGRRLLLASLSGRSSGERIRVITSQGATVTVNCTTFANSSVNSLPNPGDWIEFEIVPNSYCSIEGSAPIYVSQYAVGSSADGSVGLGGIGDPFAMMIVPIEQYINNYVFEVLSDFALNFITIYIAPQHFQPDSIFVDASTVSDWNTVYCALTRTICGYIARVSVSAGEHRLFHRDSSARVGVSAYGFNQDNSYGYPGGLRLVPVQLATVSFENPTYTVGEGDGSIRITIRRSGATDMKVIALIAAGMFQGTASFDLDYIFDSRIITFEVGEEEKQVTVLIEEDSVLEMTESFELYLTGGAGVHLSPFPRTDIIIDDNDGTIVLEPACGSMLGGAGVIVTLQGGPEIKDMNEISCIFDEVTVNGVFVAAKQALCVSPLLTTTGRIPFQLQVFDESRRSFFSAESVFTSLSFTDSFEVYVANEDLEFSTGEMIHVHWSPLSIFPMEPPNTYTVDIDLLELNMNTKVWQESLMLAADMENNGEAEIRVPDMGGGSEQEPYSPVIVRIGISSSSSINSWWSIKTRPNFRYFETTGKLCTENY